MDHGVRGKKLICRRHFIDHSAGGPNDVVSSAPPLKSSLDIWAGLVYNLSGPYLHIAWPKNQFPFIYILFR